MTSSARQHRFRQLLVAGEIAVALLLIAGASQLVRSFVRLQSQDPGFRPDNLLVLQITPSSSRLPETADVIRYYRELPEQLLRVAGVAAVSAVNTLPISGGDSRGELLIDGMTFAGQPPSASYRRVLPNYFRTVGMPLIAGREFTPDDGFDDPKVVIVGLGMATQHFGTAAAALNRRIKVGPPENEPWLTIVGVVPDVRNESLEARDQYATYEPHPQRPWRTMNLAIRTEVDPLSIAPAIRAALQHMDREILIEHMSTMHDRISASVAPRRITAQLVTAVGVLALLLALLGVYALMAQLVTERRREFGIRAALGAQARDLHILVIRQALLLAGAGVMTGLLLSIGTRTAITSLLFESSGAELWPLVVATTLMIATAVLTAWIPARRAARTDPALAFRS